MRALWRSLPYALRSAAERLAGAGAGVPGGGGTEAGATSVSARSAGRRGGVATHCHYRAVCAWAARHQENRRRMARYQPVKSRRGPQKAICAAASILAATYHMLKNRVPYHDLGADYFVIAVPRCCAPAASGYFKAQRRYGLVIRSLDRTRLVARRRCFNRLGRGGFRVLGRRSSRMSPGWTAAINSTGCLTDRARGHIVLASPFGGRTDEKCEHHFSP